LKYLPLNSLIKSWCNRENQFCKAELVFKYEKSSIDKMIFVIYINWSTFREYSLNKEAGRLPLAKGVFLERRAVWPIS